MAEETERVGVLVISIPKAVRGGSLASAAGQRARGWRSGRRASATSAVPTMLSARKAVKAPW
jgi:hypothetical protein